VSRRSLQHAASPRALAELRTLCLLIGPCPTPARSTHAALSTAPRRPIDRDGCICRNRGLPLAGSAAMPQRSPPSPTRVPMNEGGSVNVLGLAALALPISSAIAASYSSRRFHVLLNRPRAPSSCQQLADRALLSGDERPPPAPSSPPSPPASPPPVARPRTSTSK